uniref:LIM domain 7a n=1 Tax=Gouania willdenowi TaxID=441366 RepID=A0A8C5ETI2_GOUWI
MKSRLRLPTSCVSNGFFFVCFPYRLINRIKPGVVRRVNRLPTPIAGLDNLNVFLRACGKLGLKEAQLFHPGDLQDLSTRVTVKHEETCRRLKNVLITIYWLGRRAQSDHFYDGPYLNFKAFEGLLGTALYKALQDTSSQKGGSIRDSGFGDRWYSEREELNHLRAGGGGGGGRHRRDDSSDSLDSLGSRPHSVSSETTVKGSSEGCCSDAEVEFVFRMADKDSKAYRRSLVLTPKTTAQFNQFLPTKDKQPSYVPAPLRKKRAERNEESRRSWASSGYAEDEGTLTRSKSTSDIDSNPSVTRLQRYEELQKYREQIKDSDDKWQDDLSKWKSRRRSVNSDIVKKKEEREQIEQITTTSSRRSKTFREMQEERENNRSRFSSIDILKDDDVFERPAISLRSRTLPTRSYTIDTPYSSGTSASHPKEEEPPSASLATGRASSPLTTHSIDRVDGPAGRKSPTSITSNSSTNSYQSSVAAPSQKSPVLLRSRSTKTEENTSVVSSTSSLQRLPQPSRPLSVSRVSASLPRSYQKMDSARLTSVVTPRPFGAQASRISSLSRTNPMDNSQKPINGEVSASKKSLVPSRYHQFMTPEDEEQSSSAHSSEDEEEQSEKEERSTSSVQVVSSTQNISPVAPQVKREAPVIPAAAKESSQESRSEMRISLNQKPNSSRDFGFQATWDSTGARVTSVQPGSPAQMCQLQPGDEVLTVNGHKVAELSYTEWKSQLEEALQEGSLVMDISREGQNKSEPISLKNLKRRSEFFEKEEERRRQEKWQKEQERLLQVEFYIFSLKCISVMFAPKRLKTQRTQLKIKYPLMVHLRVSIPSSLEANDQTVSLRSAESPFSQPTSLLWEAEEDRERKEEQERQRQAEEKRKREEEERELQRLREERARRERQEEEERKRREEEELQWQRKREDEERKRREEEELQLQRKREEERNRREEELRWQKKREEEEEKRRREEEELRWQRKKEEEEERSGLGERKGSQSVSQAELDRQQILNEMKKKAPLLTDSSWIRQRSASSASNKDSDIPPMRRGESLDNLNNSWRSSWTPRGNSHVQNYARPHSALSGRTSFFGGGSGPQRPASTLPSSYSMSSMRGGAGTPTSAWSASSPSPTTSPEPWDGHQQRNRSVSGKKICTFCENPLGKGAAMIIESLGLCYHLSCFKVRAGIPISAPEHIGSTSWPIFENYPDRFNYFLILLI